MVSTALRADLGAPQQPLCLLLVVAGLVAAAAATAGDDAVQLGDLDFIDQLTNPCQVGREGGLLAAGRRQQPRADAELAVEVRLAGVLVRTVRDASGVPECNGLHLDSQPRISDISGLPRYQALTEMFRVFLYETAHLYLLAQEMVQSHHTCGNESLRLVDEVFSLAGRLQNILCVISETVPDRLLAPAREAIGRVTLHRFRDCPRRLMRNCLVLQNTADMLALSQQYILETSEAQNNLLQPRLIRTERQMDLFNRPRHAD